MFTAEQIKAAHAKVKSGADFPQYVKDLIQLGVTSYETYVSDGHTEYHGTDGYTATSGAKYERLAIADNANASRFKTGLKEHQEGKTDYPAFCTLCAASGIDKWIVDMNEGACSYYDKGGNTLFTEKIPV